STSLSKSYKTRFERARGGEFRVPQASGRQNPAQRHIRLRSGTISEAPSSRPSPNVTARPARRHEARCRPDPGVDMVVNRTFISVTMALVGLNVALVLAQQSPVSPGSLVIIPQPRTQPAVSAAAPARPQPQAQPAAPAGEYIGQDTCTACHEDKETSIKG